MRKYNLYFEANRSRFSFSFKNTWPADCQVHTHRLAPTWPLLQVLATFLCTTKYSTNSCRSSAGTLIIALLQRFSLWPLHLATQLCMQSWSWYSANFAIPLANVTWYITSTTSSAGIIGLVFNVQQAWIRSVAVPTSWTMFWAQARQATAQCHQWDMRVYQEELLWGSGRGNDEMGMDCQGKQEWQNLQKASGRRSNTVYPTRRTRSVLHTLAYQSRVPRRDTRAHAKNHYCPSRKAALLSFGWMVTYRANLSFR